MLHVRCGVVWCGVVCSPGPGHSETGLAGATGMQSRTARADPAPLSSLPYKPRTSLHTHQATKVRQDRAE